MSYKNIMVCIDNSRQTETRLEYAITMALEHGAHLTGLYLTQNFIPYVPYEGIGYFTVEAEKHAEMLCHRVKRAFYDAIEPSGINFDWLAFDSRDLDAAIIHSLTTDLLIAGQPDPNDPETLVVDGFPEILLFGTGNPMLFFPHTYAYTQPQPFDTILIAWNESKEATRAVKDALPLLKKANKVIVLNIDKASDRATDLPDVDIAVYLYRHGIKAEVIRGQCPKTEIGQYLLSRAIDWNVNLLVMGAYGHSQLTEFVFGGVTRTVLREMTVPVLMSH